MMISSWGKNSNRISKRLRGRQQKKQGEENIFRGGMVVRNPAGRIASDAIPWVEMENRGLKMTNKSRERGF